MSGAAAVKKAEEEKKKPAAPSPFSQMAPAQAESEKKKAPAFRPGADLFGDELMTSAPTVDEQARASHEAGVKKEMQGLKRAAERKIRRKHGQWGGKVKQKGN
ncbi:MAG: hypothetical protein WC759_03280 [Candidatus Micrarchaeia archaeon]|jgi:hypothetical protein